MKGTSWGLKAARQRASVQPRSHPAGRRPSPSSSPRATADNWGQSPTPGAFRDVPENGEGRWQHDGH